MEVLPSDPVKVETSSAIMKVHVVRLTEDAEVVTALQQLVASHLPLGGCVLACVGSVKRATLRYATRRVETLEGPFEVLSLSGTLSPAGSHLHTCLGTADGQTVGGHVMGGLVTQTTMELVVGQLEKVTLSREWDAKTGFRELVVTPVREEEPAK